VLGKNLANSTSVQKWEGKALGFADETEAQIPKSINRIRIQGAGSRFVHGGACLQEVVVPVLEINKARKSDIEQVEIDIISGTSNITSNTFAVSFYQKQPVADKIQPRQIKAGFYTSSGQLISDVITLLFNSTEKRDKAFFLLPRLLNTTGGMCISNLKNRLREQVNSKYIKASLTECSSHLAVSLMIFKRIIIWMH
jgi:hypothetical protein